MTVRDGRVLGDVSGWRGCCVGVLLGLLFSGVGDGAGAYGWQGARAGAAFAITMML